MREQEGNSLPDLLTIQFWTAPQRSPPAGLCLAGKAGSRGKASGHQAKADGYRRLRLFLDLSAAAAGAALPPAAAITPS